MHRAAVGADEVRRAKMPSKTLKAIDARNYEQWREWLAKHHESESEVWLVFHKRQTGRPSVAYDAAVDEALCFGWIDSLIKRLEPEAAPAALLFAHVAVESNAGVGSPWRRLSAALTNCVGAVRATAGVRGCRR